MTVQSTPFSCSILAKVEGFPEAEIQVCVCECFFLIIIPQNGLFLVYSSINLNTFIDSYGLHQYLHPKTLPHALPHLHPSSIPDSHKLQLEGQLWRLASFTKRNASEIHPGWPGLLVILFLFLPSSISLNGRSLPTH